MPKDIIYLILKKCLTNFMCMLNYSRRFSFNIYNEIFLTIAPIILKIFRTIMFCMSMEKIKIKVLLVYCKYIKIKQYIFKCLKILHYIILYYKI